ncbi:hypothetical protein Micbo1qcDRAFT_231099 [Microdochium bolleyi]|uniref:PNPLA domain-containing protein n=1 Tax=Microdochium bolleyi TaxID=196109 RepID=A0A136JFL1_9PEZI|nr:hypothetical protein Micbo1qcDRAFT_231099 [Microdochium bolleyi]
MAEKDGPVFLLSLDGGGVRGICELVVLDAIMKRIQEKQGLSKLPRPCDYFHVIGGVSTGGLVSILLGRLQMTTTDAMAAYSDFAKTIFGSGNWRLRSFIPFAREHKAGVKVGRTLFGTKKLEEVVQGLVATTKNDEMLLDERNQALAKAFVCTQKHSDTGAKSLILLRTYKVPAKPLSQSSLQQLEESTESEQSNEESSGDRQDSSSKERQPIPNYENCKIWEAARATSAASVFFTPMELRDDSEESTLLIDAAVGCNNPVKEVIAEATALFGIERKLGCILSLGTGVQGLGHITTETGSVWALLKAAKMHLTTSEVVNREVEGRIRPEANAYFRLNPPMVKKVGLASYKKIDQLAADTTEYLKERETADIVEKVVDILLSNRTPKLNLGQCAFGDQGQFAPRKPPQGREVTTSHFIGRDDVIQKLAAKLVTDQTTRSSALIWAPGGTGKTSTASKFLDEYESEFDEIFWVNATNEDTINVGYALIAEREELAASGNSATRQVLDWLASLSSRWLLVLDNAQGDVTSYIPPGTRGCLLFTSRNRDIKPRVLKDDIIELENLEEKDAITLLLNIAEMDPQSQRNRRDAAKIVRDQLAYLPLAIEQAAEHVQRQEISLVEYASRFEKQRTFLLNRRPGSKAVEAAQQVLPGTTAVHVAFDLTYEVLAQTAHGDTPEAHDAKNALRLLSAFSFYASDGLMGNIFERAAKARPAERTPEELGSKTMLSLEPLLALEGDMKKWDMGAFSRGVVYLQRRSLLKVDDTKSVFSMHPLIHEWARERSVDRERLSRAEAARHVLFDSFGAGLGTHDWVFNFRIMPHMRACLESTDTVAEKDPISDARQRQKYAKMLCSSLRDHDAVDVLAKPILACGSREWVFSHVYWDMLETVSEAMLRTGDISRAEEVIKPVLKAQTMMIADGKLQASDIVVLNTRAMQANLLIERGHWDEAETILRSIIDICDRAQGDGPWTEPWLSLLENGYTREGLFEEAYEVASALHARCVQRYEAKHKKVVDSTRTLAGTCTQVQRFRRAEELIQSVIEIEEHQSQAGVRVASWLISQIILGNALAGQERWDEVYKLFAMLIEYQDKEVPMADRKIELPQSYQGLAQAALFTGRQQEGLELWLHSFELLERQFGLENYRTVQAAMHLARWLAQAQEVGVVMEGPQWDAFFAKASKIV